MKKNEIYTIEVQFHNLDNYKLGDIKTRISIGKGGYYK